MPRGVTPVRSRDPERIRSLVERDGVAILSGWGTSADDAVEAARAVFGPALLHAPPADEVVPAGVGGRRRAGSTNAHTDGAVHGDHCPDYVLLCGAVWSGAGGESFVVDGEAVVDHLAGGPGGRELVHRLQTVTVDHSVPGRRRVGSTVIGRTSAGRLMLRCYATQRPAASSEAADEDAAMLSRWRETIDAAASAAPRFAVRAGEVAVVDNYRMMHGRDACPDATQRLWRVWTWTTAAHGVPGRERVLEPRTIAN